MKKEKHEENCKYCGDPFMTIKGEYCSTKCKMAFWRRKKREEGEKMYCWFCGKLLTFGHWKFCNKKCTNDFYHREKKEEFQKRRGNCLICNSKIPPRIKKGDFCSHNCDNYLKKMKELGGEVKIILEGGSIIFTKKYDKIREVRELYKNPEIYNSKYHPYRKKKRVKEEEKEELETPDKEFKEERL